MASHESGDCDDVEGGCEKSEEDPTEAAKDGEHGEECEVKDGSGDKEEPEDVGVGGRSDKWERARVECDVWELWGLGWIDLPTETNKFKTKTTFCEVEIRKDQQ